MASILSYDKVKKRERRKRIDKFISKNPENVITDENTLQYLRMSVTKKDFRYMPEISPAMFGIIKSAYRDDDRLLPDDLIDRLFDLHRALEILKDENPDDEEYTRELQLIILEEIIPLVRGMK